MDEGLRLHIESANDATLWTDYEANRLIDTLGRDRCALAGVGVSIAYEALNGSVNAALTIVEALFPTWWVEVKTRYLPDENPNCRWSAEIENPQPVQVTAYGETYSSHEFYYSHAHTPSLALCAALIKEAEQSA